MKRDAPRGQSTELDALIRVTAVGETGPDQSAESRLDALVSEVTQALGGEAGVLQVLSGPSERLEVRAATAGDELAATLETGAEIAAAAVREGSEVVVGDGMPADLLPAELADRGFTEARAFPIRCQGRVEGALWVAGASPLADDDLRLWAARVGCERIGALLEKLSLHESLERAMAQILESDERMLGRIGLDIHDGPTQQLSVALLEVQLLDAELGDEGSENIKEALSRIYETLGGALHEMRELIGHLRPAQFEDRALPDILNDAVTAFEARSGAEVVLNLDGDFPVNGVSVTQRITFYRVLQETLTNAYRHGQARRCRVDLTQEPGGISLVVEDDGSGFDVEHALRPRPGVPIARFGIHGIRDRAELLGGVCEITSVPGEGSSVRVFLPEWQAPPEGDQVVDGG